MCCMVMAAMCAPRVKVLSKGVYYAGLKVAHNAPCECLFFSVSFRFSFGVRFNYQALRL